MADLCFAEYIWLDGSVPVRNIRSKTRIIDLSDFETEDEYGAFLEEATPEMFPEWGFDGSSTNQADGHDSDLLLKPVTVVDDPIRGVGNYLVLCEVNNADGTPHESNSRAQLRAILEAGAAKDDPWIGFEQEYTLFKGRNPLGWPENGFPAPQGPYYCGVGAEEIFGRQLVEMHAHACVAAGIMYYGLNAEVMAGQWEFQIGYRDVEGEDAGVLNVADHVWLARWLLYRLGEDLGIRVSFDNKPVKGDWNGAGMHTNISTKEMRNAKTGRAAIDKAVERLSKKHKEHIRLYGYNNDQRLTGDHETAHIDTFKAGAADRGCAIRIPRMVELKGHGYLEDRRPGANSDPYLVAARLCTTISDIDENIMKFSSWPRVKAA